MKFKKGSKHAFDPNQFLASRAQRGALGMGDIMKIANRSGGMDVIKLAGALNKTKAPK